jgi:hypothetical protein
LKFSLRSHQSANNELMSPRSDAINTTLDRIMAGIGALIPTALALHMFGNLGGAVFHHGSAVFYWWKWYWGAILFLAPATLAMLCWWFVLKGHHASSRARMTCAMIGGVLLGGISFVSPMIFMLSFKQGLLPAILITGPVGWVVGVSLGTLYGLVRLRTPKGRPS